MHILFAQDFFPQFLFVFLECYFLISVISIHSSLVCMCIAGVEKAQHSLCPIFDILFLIYNCSQVEEFELFLSKVLCSLSF